MDPEQTDRDAELERRVLALCDEVLAQPGSERADYLARRCAGRPALRAAVEAVLQAIEDSGCFLQIRLDEEEVQDPP